MFKRNKKEITINYRYEHEGSGGSSKGIVFNDVEQLSKYLERQLEVDGELVITHLIDNEIELTTSRSVEYEHLTDRSNEIGELVKDYIRERAVEMDAYAVFAKGDLKGVFGQRYNAGFKKTFLMREGYGEEDIVTKAIKTDSFEDIVI